MKVSATDIQSVSECSHGHVLLQFLLHESGGEEAHLVVVAVRHAPVLSPPALSSPVVLPGVEKYFSEECVENVEHSWSTIFPPLPFFIE